MNGLWFASSLIMALTVIAVLLIVLRPEVGQQPVSLKVRRGYGVLVIVSVVLCLAATVNLVLSVL